MKRCFPIIEVHELGRDTVEINLSSNEFILIVTEEEHPIMLYKKQNVPFIISTDDAGILRTNLSHQ